MQPEMSSRRLGRECLQGLGGAEVLIFMPGVADEAEVEALHRLARPSGQPQPRGDTRPALAGTYVPPRSWRRHDQPARLAAIDATDEVERWPPTARAPNDHRRGRTPHRCREERACILR